MKSPTKFFFFVCISLAAVLVCLFYFELFDKKFLWRPDSFLTRGIREKSWMTSNETKTSVKAESEIESLSISTTKLKNKWIVVTSVNYPSEDVKRLASFPEWTLVVVGDSKTPPDWKLPGVHFLSLETQRNMGFRSVYSLPTNSYTRKNAGYLYAIANGAEWIYDTDDDNKPYGKGLEQFDYEEVVSGLRFQQGDIPEPFNASSILYCFTFGIMITALI